MKNTMLHLFKRNKNSAARMTPVERLQEYLALAKEMAERAYTADTHRQQERALSLYRHTVEVIQEGMLLEVPGSGLGPKSNSAAGIRQQLGILSRNVMDRIMYLESAPSRQPKTEIVRPSAVRSRGMPTVKRQRQGKPSQPAMQATAASVVDGVRRVGKAAREVIAGETGRHREQILGEMLVTNPGIDWDDISGLGVAKQALYESVILPSVRPDLFNGLRAPARGLLLYGPPGNGKTLLAKALASKAEASFFNISASSLTSKWVGEGEKLVRALFEVASELAPSIIFIDEIDSILSSRSTNENEASRKLKTEFLVQFDGLSSSNDRILVIGATNRPHELDDAALRRLVKRIYIPLPDREGRLSIVRNLFRQQEQMLSQGELNRVIRATEGYSASDLTALCKEASMVAIRELGPDVATVSASELRPVVYADFEKALGTIKPSTNRRLLESFDAFTRDYGTR